MDKKFGGLFLIISLGVVAVSEAQLPERPVTSDIPQQSVYLGLAGWDFIYPNYSMNMIFTNPAGISK